MDVDVAVIGAGQAGLCAAHHLRRAGLAAIGSLGWQDAAATFVVLDDSPAPGGAWQLRWPGLTMAAAHRAHTLPGMPLSVPDAEASAASAVPAYFAQYEDAFALHVQRPVHVRAVRRDGDRFAVESRHVRLPDEQVTFRARALISATGSWGKPFWPVYPGRDSFIGRQLHARDYRTPAELADGPVVVVGGGASAVHIVAELSAVTPTCWVTRNPPRIDPRDRTPAVEAAAAAGAMVARPMFERIGARGVWFAPWEPGDAGAADGGAADGGTDDDGTGGAGTGWVDGPPFVAAGAIVWATGFRPSLGHLAPLHLRTPGGPLHLDGGAVVAEPRVLVIGSAAGGAQGCGAETSEAVRDLLARLGP
ncbi:MAG: NAD(P)-binding domain-containing protein [Cellulomonas sp.]|nr:NAD(P)-binding domain-containing protein [Cellulomonas sp.]